MLRERDITDFLHQRGATVVAMLVACVCTVIGWQDGAMMPLPAEEGWALGPVSSWLPSGALMASAALSLAVNFIVALLTVYITRGFNLLRSLTSLVATMYLMMQIATPAVLGRFTAATMLPLVALLATVLLFSVYSDAQPRARLRVMLVFVLFGAGMLVCPQCIYYIPVMMIGCVQMRQAGLRTFIAILLGLAAPLWILGGFGLVDLRSLTNPFTLIFTPLWSNAAQAAGLPAIMIVTAACTMFLGVVFTVANLLKILSYNARTRALNGFFTLMMIFTVVFALIDFAHLDIYIPMLNMTVAYQIGHFFTYRRQRRTYIPLLLIMAGYFILYLWAVPA